MLRIVLLLIAICSCLAFKPLLHKARPVNLLKMVHTDSEKWQIDIDSAEIEVDSSAGIERKKEQARLAEEAKKREEEEAKQRALELEAKKQAEALKQEIVAKPVVQASPVSVIQPVQVVKPKVVEKPSTALSSEKTTAFDVGLLIAFPIMIGTLGFFFLFPIFGEQWSQGSIGPN